MQHGDTPVQWIPVAGRHFAAVQRTAAYGRVRQLPSRDVHGNGKDRDPMGPMGFHQPWAFDWHQDRWPWMTLNCCKVEFSRNFPWFRVFGPTTKIWMQIDPYCQQQKCSPVNVLSSYVRVMQIFAGVREIWGVKQKSGRLRCRFSYLSLAIFLESSSPRLKSATHSICVKLSYYISMITLHNAVVHLP